ncbi:MAG: CoA pyrophosphatase [Desulfobacteraceae bacterium]|nr:MAG: CoA pyrophosphatase [Desulfobacteraceae bacterium]
MLPELNARFLTRLLSAADVPVAEKTLPGDCTSVFLLLYNKADGPFILAILKADSPGYAWSNQVALPGGHVDETDSTPLEAAYRELEEELGIYRQQVVFTGSMGHFQTIQQKDIEVFVGLWDGRIESVAYDSREISKVLELPVALILKTHLSSHFQGRIPNIMELLYPFKDLVVWGVTARILHYFLELLLANLDHSIVNDLLMTIQDTP